MAAHGQLGPALGHGPEALRIASEIGHRRWMAAARWALGRTYLALLMPIEAGAHLEAGLPLARGLGSAWWLAHLAASLAHAYLLGGEPRRAAAIARGVLARRQQPRTLSERRVSWMWGEHALAGHDWAAALRAADDLIASAPGRPAAGPCRGSPSCRARR